MLNCWVANVIVRHSVPRTATATQEPTGGVLHVVVALLAIVPPAVEYGDLNQEETLSHHFSGHRQTTSTFYMRLFRYTAFLFLFTFKSNIF